MSYGCVVVLFPDPSHDQIHEGSGYETNGWEQSGGASCEIYVPNMNCHLRLNSSL